LVAGVSERLHPALGSAIMAHIYISQTVWTAALVFKISISSTAVLATPLSSGDKVSRPLGGEFWFSKTAKKSAWALTRSVSFAYRLTHPVFSLPQRVIASLLDTEEVGISIPDLLVARDFERTSPPDVGAKSRVQTRGELCRTVADVARRHHLPLPFFANLIWAESSFKAKTISRAGAQGIAQFMLKTADQYGLDNPFDSIHAINVSARFLTELRISLVISGLRRQPTTLDPAV
jgi:hypothetical protein